jgi:hypothetical protein
MSVACALAVAAWLSAAKAAQDASLAPPAQDGPSARDSEGPGQRTPAEAAPGSVIIEAEPIVEPTLDSLMRSLRDTLERGRRPLSPVERQLAGGIIEIDTRYGRFCLAPLPTYLSSSLTTSGGLTSFCSPY